ncbi:MAG: N-acetyltransferase [Pseudonocardiales bacterium]|nr:MAG: N-acetyltransferase [Pseudonocardiales bacterium]
MADVSVRSAQSDDVTEIARIQLETWRAGYATILPAAVLESLSSEATQQAWHQAVAAPPSPRHHVLIAQEQDWRVGFVAFGPAEDLQPGDPDPGSTIALGPLLVEPRWGRRGHGSRLLAAAVDHARGDGMARAIVWLPERDDASREFFISAGWAPDGLARALDTGSGELREIRLHVSLAEAAA